MRFHGFGVERTTRTRVYSVPQESATFQSIPLAETIKVGFLTKIPLSVVSRFSFLQKSQRVAVIVVSALPSALYRSTSSSSILSWLGLTTVARFPRTKAVFLPAASAWGSAKFWITEPTGKSGPFPAKTRRGSVQASRAKENL